MKNKIILIIAIFFIGTVSVSAKEKVTLSDCVDGDTIKIQLKDDTTIYSIRMLAVDTPESVHPTKGVEYYGKEASEYTCNLVTNAKKLEIEYDDNSDKLDKYDRLLVWVFVDGELLQKKLIENGYAKVAYLYDDYKYTEELEKVQEKASTLGIGIWDEEAKTKYNQENNISDKETENTDSEIQSLIKKIKGFEITDYIFIAILLLIVVFCSNKKIKNNAKKRLKKYFK